MTHVVLSLGSNQNRETNIRIAVNKIRDKFGEISASPVYETVAVGFDGPAFLNLVVGMHTNRTLDEIRVELREIEKESGRVRGKKSFGNRVLDIDIVLYGNENMRPDHNIPRDEIEKYAYVLKPLSDLYPQLRHPVTGKTYNQLWEEFSDSNQHLKLSEYLL